MTGASDGIGRACVQALAAAGATVVMVGRSEAKTAAAARAIMAQTGSRSITLGDRGPVAAGGGARPRGPPARTRLPVVDVLVNNAGALFLERQLTAEGLERTFALNHLAYFTLTLLLLDRLAAAARPGAPARVLCVSSRAHREANLRLDDLQGAQHYAGWRAYANTKLANVLFTRALAARLDPARVVVHALHPGVVSTRFALNNGKRGRMMRRIMDVVSVDAETGADTIDLAVHRGRGRDEQRRLLGQARPHRTVGSGARPGAGRVALVGQRRAGRPRCRRDGRRVGRRPRRATPVAQRLMRDWLRLGVIVARLAPLGLSLRRDHRRWIRWGAPMPRSEAFHQARARRIVRELAALGPTFVKLAQIFSTRADLVAEPYLSELGTLTDRVPPVAWPALRAVLARAWGVDPDTVVDALDPEPLAAGSLGQVHRARHLGREVVVKILRPGVEAVVARDVRVARRIVDWVYARFPHHHVLGFRVVLDEFAVHVREEMDFVREGAQCARMRERFADERRLRIPEVISELTRHEVLVLEYLPGTRIDALDARIAAGTVSARALVETLIECYARMMLRDGVFHADPHPGNLLVDDAGRIILLDFGMVIDVDVKTRKALFDTILATIRRDPEGDGERVLRARHGGAGDVGRDDAGAGARAARHRLHRVGDDRTHAHARRTRDARAVRVAHRAAG